MPQLDGLCDSFICTFSSNCEQTYKNATSLRRHYKETHSLTPEQADKMIWGDDGVFEGRKRICPEEGCGNTFAVKEILKNHLSKTHKISLELLDEKCLNLLESLPLKFKASEAKCCHLCPVSFDMPKRLKHHYVKSHRMEESAAYSIVFKLATAEDEQPNLEADQIVDTMGVGGDADHPIVSKDDVVDPNVANIEDPCPMAAEGTSLSVDEDDDGRVESSYTENDFQLLSISDHDDGQIESSYTQNDFQPSVPMSTSTHEDGQVESSFTGNDYNSDSDFVNMGYDPSTEPMNTESKSSKNTEANSSSSLENIDQSRVDSFTPRSRSRRSSKSSRSRSSSYSTSSSQRSSSRSSARSSSANSSRKPSKDEVAKKKMEDTIKELQEKLQRMENGQSQSNVQSTQPRQKKVYKKASSKTSTVNCPVCEKTYEHTFTARRHMKVKHAMDQEEVDRLMEGVSETSKKCLHCHQWRANLHEHQKTCKVLKQKNMPKPKPVEVPKTTADNTRSTKGSNIFMEEFRNWSE